MFASIRTAVGTCATWVAGLAFVALTATAPWAYGGVEQWFRAWAAALLAICVAAGAVGLLMTPGSGGRGAIFGPLLPLVGLVVLAGWQLHVGIMPIGAAEAGTGPQTIYPAATRLALAWLIAACAATLLGGIVFSKESALHGLMAACLVAAAAVAFFGIALRLTGEDRVIRGMTFVGDPFARFVNRNNAAAFLQLGVASGLGLLRSASRRGSGDQYETFLGGGYRGIDRGTLYLILMTLLGFCIAGVVASRSRGGMIATVVTLAVGLVLFRRRGVAGRVLLLLPPIAVAVLLTAWLGLSATTLERFQSLSLDEILTQGRVPHWRDATGAMAARPVFGAGLGTYGYAHQEFSRVPPEAWYEHADNQFVELAVEAGAVGGAIVAAGAALLAFGVFRGAGLPVERVLLTSLVAGQAVHAVFDYGILVPAVALPAAALWGAALMRLLSRQDGFEMRRSSRPAGMLVAVTAVVAGAGLIWSFGEHRSAWAIDRYAVASDRTDRPGRLDDERLDWYLRELTAALDRRPDDAAGHRALGQLYVHRYRTNTVEGLRQLDPALTEPVAWRATGMVSLHRAVNGLARSGASAGIDAIRQDALVQRDLVPARRHFAAAAEACPRLTGVWLPLASLSFLGDDETPDGVAEIRTAARLFPADIESLQVAARMAWQAGDGSLAGECWRRAFGLRAEGYGSLVSTLSAEVGEEEAVELTAPDDATALLDVGSEAADLGDGTLQAALGRRLAEEVESLPAGPIRWRGKAVAAWLLGDEKAGDLFRGAVAAGPLDVDTRVDYARFLWDRGEAAAALDELRTAVALDSPDGGLRGLLETWQRAAPKHAAAGDAGVADFPKNGDRDRERP